MSKPEWGTKRVCLQCSERFYDLGKDPIKCPHCGDTLSVEEFLRLQASTAGKVKRSTKGKVHEEIEIITDDDAVFADSADDELELIEDASDLGDDEDDMAEVMEKVEKDGE